MNSTTQNENSPAGSGNPENGHEEIETFGAAGPILVFMFFLWGFTLAAAASAVS